jgi:hypothetical protein
MASDLSRTLPRCLADHDPGWRPIPGWDAGRLRAVGERDEELAEEEAAALRRLTDPAVA